MLAQRAADSRVRQVALCLKRTTRHQEALRKKQALRTVAEQLEEITMKNVNIIVGKEEGEDESLSLRAATLPKLVDCTTQPKNYAPGLMEDFVLTLEVGGAEEHDYAKREMVMNSV